LVLASDCRRAPSRAANGWRAIEAIVSTGGGFAVDLAATAATVLMLCMLPAAGGRRSGRDAMRADVDGGGWWVVEARPTTGRMGAGERRRERGRQSERRRKEEEERERRGVERVRRRAGQKRHGERQGTGVVLLLRGGGLSSLGCLGLFEGFGGRNAKRWRATTGRERERGREGRK
jgi:hypothetical protein